VSGCGPRPVLQCLRSTCPSPIGILTSISGLQTNSGRFSEDAETAIRNAISQFIPFLSSGILRRAAKTLVHSFRSKQMNNPYPDSFAHQNFSHFFSAGSFHPPAVVPSSTAKFRERRLVNCHIMTIVMPRGTGQGGWLEKQRLWHPGVPPMTMRRDFGRLVQLPVVSSESRCAACAPVSGSRKFPNQGARSDWTSEGVKTSV
jgi:hypothetical protein